MAVRAPTSAPHILQGPCLSPRPLHRLAGVSEGPTLVEIITPFPRRISRPPGYVGGFLVLQRPCPACVTEGVPSGHSPKTTPMAGLIPDLSSPRLYPLGVPSPDLSPHSLDPEQEAPSCVWTLGWHTHVSGQCG